MKGLINPALKRKLNKVSLASVASLSAVACVLGTIVVFTPKDKTNENNETLITITQQVDETISVEEAYKVLQKARKIKIPTEQVTWVEEDGTKSKYQQAKEEDVVYASRQLSNAIEDYFKACGATDWVSDKNKQFWPDDIEYIVTAIAFNESSYRTNCMNAGGKGGITGVYKSALLKTFSEQWLVYRIWKDTIPQVNCNLDEVDIFNPATCLELTLENMGYNLANRFKQDKYFTDIDGQKKCVWDTLEYSEELQIRLVIASHRFGVGNVINSIYGRNYNEEEKRYIPLEEYIYGGYVNSVMEKALELEQVYEQGFGY